jgi:cell division protein FtsZ
MNSGVAIMGVGVAEGEGRATKAIDAALASPLLDENDIYGSRGILLYISSGAKEVTMDEVSQITDYVQQAANNDTEIIWGVCHDDSLEDEVSVTLIATGFKNNETRPAPAKEKVVVTIDQLNQKVAEVTQPIVLAHKNDEVIKVELKTVEPTFEVEFKTDEPKVTISTEPVFTIRHIENKETNNSQSVPASNPVNEKTNDRADVNKEFLKRRLGSNRFNDPKYIQEMEKTPSFERKNRKFDNIPHSSQSHLSRYTIVDNYENENGNSLELKKNSFLSDKPD